MSATRKFLYAFITVALLWCAIVCLYSGYLHRLPASDDPAARESYLVGRSIGQPGAPLFGVLLALWLRFVVRKKRVHASGARAVIQER